MRRAARSGIDAPHDLYRRLSPGLREAIEGRNSVYRMNVFMGNFRFGAPHDYRVISESQYAQPVMDASATRRARCTPAVRTRATGEKVLHVSPWMAEGIEGDETPEGDALLDAVCREIFAIGDELSYFHRWAPTGMLIWDNWRVLHAVSGHDPQYARHLQRTTIKGDYGLGYFEHGASNTNKMLERAY